MNDYPNMVHPDDLRKVADGVEHANHACEQIAREWAAAADIRKAVTAIVEFDPTGTPDAFVKWHGLMEDARTALAKAEDGS